MQTDPFRAFGEPVSDEIERVNQLMDAMRGAEIDYSTVTAEQLRARMRGDAAAQAVQIDEAQERFLPGPDGDVPVRVLVPPEVDGVYVHIHGGGWMAGDHTAGDPWLWPRAQEANAATVSIGYRLAPEHPYPAGPDDCEAAACWVIEHAQREFGTDRVVFGGESAGAHLAVVTLLRLRDRHGWTGARGVELRYGMYDLRMNAAIRAASGPGLTRDTVPLLLGWFVDESLREDPDVSPIFADLRDMPPALFVCGTGDTLVEDTLFMWARWRAAGNDAELRLFAGAPHAFDLMPLTVGAEALELVSAFVGERLRA